MPWINNILQRALRKKIFFVEAINFRKRVSVVRTMRKQYQSPERRRHAGHRKKCKEMKERMVWNVDGWKAICLENKSEWPCLTLKAKLKCCWRPFWQESSKKVFYENENISQKIWMEIEKIGTFDKSNSWLETFVVAVDVVVMEAETRFLIGLNCVLKYRWHFCEGRIQPVIDRNEKNGKFGIRRTGRAGGISARPFDG